MEPEVVKTERRGRKRKRKDVQGASKKTAVETRSKVFIGRYVKKEFEGSGVFIGKIVSYDTGLYRVDYEDGDCEDLETSEVKTFVIGDDAMDNDFCKRKKALDDYVSKKYAKNEAVKADSAANKVETVETGGGAVAGGVKTVRSGGGAVANGVELANAAKVESPSRGGAFEISGAQPEVDSASSSDLSDYGQSDDMVEVQSPPIPPPQMPPSSENFGVSEEHVSYLLSVYSFLRSFSVCLFLSPFGLDEFVGALNSSVPNTLLDAIHVALMRTLKSHVENLASEGSELASKCLRSMDWSLLDSLTWPVFLVQYLVTMKYAEGPEWKEFYVNVLERDYYTLASGRKLIILQILCDDASDSAELRAEIDMRESSEVGPDPDGVLAFADENMPRKVYPTSSKTYLSENHEAVKDINVKADVDEDGNGDECRLCGMDGTLLCCDGCPSAYHSRCIGVSKMFIPEGQWYCPECTINKTGPNVNRVTSLRGAEFFGVDPYGQVFLGICDHLLVMTTSTSSEPCTRYYSPVDIQKVLHVLTDSAEHRKIYLEICKGILQYWEIPEDILPLTDSVGLDEKYSAPSTLLAKESSDAPQVTDAGHVSSGGIEINSDNVSAATWISGNGNCNNGRHMNITCEMTNMPSYTKEANLLLSFRGRGITGDGFLYMGSSFKPQSYLNLYIHGDFAASAAASLAILSSEEKVGSQPQPSSSHRKTMSANYSLQAKAFSLAAKRFYWPNYEKKLVEVPRERCGWCLSCKASVSSKKGCLLNAAASNAIKGAGKILASLRQSKNVEGGLASIATYVMFMEESLSGLTVGPFQSPSYRNQWHKQVEQAATLSAIKASLLEFEGNIRDIAFSADWAKLVDDPGYENHNATQSTKSLPPQRGRPPKRGRKPAMVSEIADADGKDLSSDFAWWRGGMLSKHVFQKGILPHSLVKQASRQGGSGKINGVQYADGFEVPKRSRQFLWRAAVELSKTVSQLALQVRYLDLHVRWSELVRPEQPLLDGKADTEASAFRNACIVDKKVLGNKITYGVIFENQKHLPSRVLKSILEIEETGDKKEKYWFVEMRIPLYLIKEYEKKTTKVILPTADKHVSTLSNLQKKQLKTSGKNIFSFLLQKKDNLGKCFCTSCQLDVPFRIAAMCSACQGYCHEQCAISSTIRMNEHVEFLITCKRCYHEKDVTPQTEIIGDSPTSPLLMQGQDGQNIATAIKAGKQNGYEYFHQSSEKNPTTNCPKITKSGKKNGKKRRLESLDQSSEKKPTINGSKKSRSKLSLGLIWKKKNPDDTGIDFRLRNLLLKNNPNGHLLAPVCHLCTKSYNSELMYIRCEKCEKWFHADAVELQESKIMELVGFKCCRCRRIRIPICPYTDPETRKKIEAKRPHLKTTPNATILGSESNSETNDEQVNDWELDATPISLTVQEEIEQQSVHNFEVDFEPSERGPDPGPGPGPAPKKLPVRRHIKSDELDGVAFEPAGKVLNPAGESSTPVVEWDVSGNGFGDDMMFDYDGLNYEDMEFEPQTYFSFNELLASDDDPTGGNVKPGQYEAGVDMAACRFCSLTEPAPDLYCEGCGLWVHHHCSPWTEESSWDPEGGWKCGSCREWR